MKKIVHGKKAVEKGKKPIKPQDLVRLYDTVIQNYNEMPQLAGLEDDLELKQEMEAKVVCCKAHKYVFDIWFSENIITFFLLISIIISLFRCYFIALTYMGGQKWAETRALFQRAGAYANKVKNDSILPQAMREEMQALMQLIESKQFMAHANSILEAEGTSSDTNDKAKVDPSKAAIPLIDRMDDYYEDPDLTKGKPNLVPFPPAFEPLPCKPLFFDVAREHVGFPNLESKVSGPSGNTTQNTGGWFSGWGWGSKK